MELPTQDRQPAMSRSGHVLALYGGLSLCALLISAGRGDVDLYGVSGHSIRLIILSLLLGLVIGLVVVLVSRVMLRFPWARQLHRDFQVILGEQNGQEILILALASSIGEELLFRGALLPWIGVWPQALLFAALHIGPGKRFLPWTLMALVMGALFGYLTSWTGNIGAPLLAHFTINYLNLRFIVRHVLPTDDTDKDNARLGSPKRQPASPRTKDNQL